MARILISISSITPGNVKDLRAINDKMTELVEHAEQILKRSDEVFPAARGSWLRKMKAALGLLAVKDGQTLEDTINLCHRLISFSSSAAAPVEEVIRLKPGKTLIDWANACGVDLYFKGRKLTSVGKKHTSMAVRLRNKHIGRLEKQLGKPWVFIPADLESGPAKDYSAIDMSL